MGVEDYAWVEVDSVEALRSWLSEHHAQTEGVWLVTWKRTADPDRHVSYEQVVRELLCFGWIDSLAKSIDDQRTRMVITPRRPGSGWAATNKRRIIELTAEGRMAAPGLAEIEAAQRSGAWTLLDDIENLVEPAELAGALDDAPSARKQWDTFPPSARKLMLAWLAGAKRPATREARVAAIVNAAAEGRRAHTG